MHPSIHLGAAWLLTSKGFLLVVHGSDVIGQLSFLTKLFSTAWVHAYVRLLPMMSNLHVFLKCHLPTKCLATIWYLAVKGLQIAVQHSDV